MVDSHREHARRREVANKIDEMKTSPRVSFVMPAHNALPFLDESIGSILNQTFEDFEFVILDDASTDGSTAALRAWAQRDARIRRKRRARADSEAKPSSCRCAPARG